MFNFFWKELNIIPQKFVYKILILNHEHQSSFSSHRFI